MASLEDKSGPWRGRWTQRTLRAAGAMRLQLAIAGGSIWGAGSDDSGGFDIDGSYDSGSGEVAMTKSYPGLTVLYRGRWDGMAIIGTSMILGFGFQDQGEFELWPEGEGEFEIALERELELSRS